MAKKPKTSSVPRPSISDGKTVGLGWSKAYTIFVALIGVIFSILHRNHLAQMFESDRHFSHLSNLEREMTFRTEMGLYFSYYKTMCEAESFSSGLTEITRDNRTEYGHEINTLKRFNLYPEVALAYAYRTYTSIGRRMGWKMEQCWSTNRGQGLPPITSCEGNGNLHYFYINVVFALAGTLAATLFYYGVLLSDSLTGGLIAVTMFAFNHGEATRVQWTPPLRESFAYPLFAVQMLLVTYVLRVNGKKRWHTVGIAALTGTYMMSWQFAQFSLSCQVGSLFATYLLGYAQRRTMLTIVYGLMMGFVSGLVFLFFNEMLLASLFISSLITFIVILHLDSVWSRMHFQLLVSVGQALLFVGGTIGIRYAATVFLDIHDDAHIFDILRAKFTTFSNFHTRLYTCAVEFDFQPWETYSKLSMTALLPAALVVVGFVGIKMLYDAGRSVSATRVDYKTMTQDGTHLAPIVYNVVQMIVFGFIAFIIMRLKLFWTPHLCICAALLASEQLLTTITPIKLTFISRRPSLQTAFCVTLIAIGAVNGIANLRHQWSIMGEYNNPNMEQLFEWIESHTEKSSVFTGTMPTMANLKLSTGRSITMHPHYEDVGLRERVMNSYSMFSRMDNIEVHRRMKEELHTDYVVFEYNWCAKDPSREECSILGSWDRIYPELASHIPFCERVQQRMNVEPFRVLYRNDAYTISERTWRLRVLYRMHMTIKLRCYAAIVYSGFYTAYCGVFHVLIIKRVAWFLSCFGNKLNIPYY